MPSVLETAAADDSLREPPSPPAALLRLPPSLRRRIYQHVGLARCDGYPYTFDLHGRQVCFRNPPPPGSFTGLLRACRTLHAEAAALLYSANRFTIHYSCPGSLAPLRALTAPSLASLASLKVVLNQSSCHHPTNYDGLNECCRHGREDEDWGSGAHVCKRHHGHLHSPPLLGSPPSNHNRNDMAAVQALLSEWRSAAAHLSSHVGSGRLELSLICDVDPEHELGLDVANRAVAPLALLPPTKDCHIRLCKTPDPRLQQVADAAVMRARGISRPHSQPSSTQTTLLSLPRELRLRILEYTDLIAPWKEVTWSRHRRGYAVFHIRCRHEDGIQCDPVVHNGCQFRRCWLHVDTEPRIGCFCRRYHTASSSRCKCWAPPGPTLFLICRTLSRDAQLVFFSGNRFIVHDFDADQPTRIPEPASGPSGYPYDRFTVSHFLKEVVPAHCLAHIRFLEVVFPPYRHDGWPRPEHPAMQDWCTTVKWLRDKINAPGLALRLTMADAGTHETTSDRETMTYAQGMAVVEAYMDILRPLRHLAAGNDGLARFQARLAYPWAWTMATYDRMLQPDGYNWYQSQQRELNERGERLVVGDRYQSLLARDGKVPALSFWEDEIRREY